MEEKEAGRIVRRSRAEEASRQRVTVFRLGSTKWGKALLVPRLSPRQQSFASAAAYDAANEQLFDAFLRLACSKLGFVVVDESSSSSSTDDDDDDQEGSNLRKRFRLVTEDGTRVDGLTHLKTLLSASPSTTFYLMDASSPPEEAEEAEKRRKTNFEVLRRTYESSCFLDEDSYLVELAKGKAREEEEEEQRKKQEEEERVREERRRAWLALADEDSSDEEVEEQADEKRKEEEETESESMFPAELYEECARLQKEELDVLRSYFGKQLEEGQSLPRRLKIQLSIDNELSEDTLLLLRIHDYHPHISLLLVFGVKYPLAEPPLTIDVRSDSLSVGLSDRKYALLRSKLEEEAKAFTTKMTGESLVLHLVEIAKEWLRQVATHKVEKVKRVIFAEMEQQQKRKGKQASNANNPQQQGDELLLNNNNKTTGKMVIRLRRSGTNIRVNIDNNKEKEGEGEGGDEMEVMKQVFRWKYNVLSKEDVLRLQMEKIEQAKAEMEATLCRFGGHIMAEDKGDERKDKGEEEDGALFFSSAVLRVMLHHYKWNVEEIAQRFLGLLKEQQKQHTTSFWMDAMKQLFEETGIRRNKAGHNKKENTQAVVVAGSKIRCAICDQKLTCEAKMTALNLCHHWFCNGCYAQYLQVQINDGSTDAIRCPFLQCNYIVDHVTIASLISREMFVKCEYVIEAPMKTGPASQRTASLGVICDCGQSWCFTCHEECHFPATCEEAKWFYDRYGRDRISDDEDLSIKWIEGNTKHCPRCNASIQKNGGCNHMKCTKCQYDFCWVCSNPFTGSHYGCSSTSSRRERASEQLDQALNHNVAVTFLQWYGRSRTTLRKLASTQKNSWIIQKTKKLIHRKAGGGASSSAGKGDDAAAIGRAAEHILMAHRVLMGAAMYGQSRFVNSAKGQKPLKMAMTRLAYSEYFLDDLLNTPFRFFNAEYLHLACNTIKDNALKLVSEITQQRKAELHVASDASLVKELIVRRKYQQRGGKRVPMPTSMQELFERGNKALGLVHSNEQAVVVRDKDGAKIREEDLPLLQDRDVVYLMTAMEENC
ncbi:DNA-dependent ATPase protein rad54 [Balamuthia mandrillaris]